MFLRLCKKKYYDLCKYTSHLQAPTTSDDYSTEQSTGGGTGDSSYQNSWVDYVILAEGILGVVSNLFAIVVICSYKKMRQRLGIILIINQSALDLVASLTSAAFFATVHGYNMFVSPYAGAAGSAFCKLWANSLWSWGLMTSSSWNLVAITLERYLSIACPLYHKMAVTRRKLYAAVLTAWVVGLSFRAVFAIPTSRYADGLCYVYSNWVSEDWRMMFGVSSPIMQFFLPAALMVYMYARMLLVLRRKIKPVSGFPQGTSAPKNMSRAHKNLLKTLLIVTACFVGLWITNQLYWFLYNTGLPLYFSLDASRISVVMVYMNCCINPFIYIFKFEEFQRAMRSLFGWKAAAEYPKSETGTHSTE